MAKVDIKMPDDFLEAMKRLGSEEDRILESVLEAGAAVVADKVRSNLSGAIGRNTKLPSRSTGQLMSALGVSPVKVNGDGGHNIKIGFAEPRSGGRSNAMIANILEYGRHRPLFRQCGDPAVDRVDAIPKLRRRFDPVVRQILRLRFQLFKPFQLLRRNVILTIVARGYLYMDEIPYVEYARRALCAWCSIPAEKEAEWQFDTNFAELHTSFRSLWMNRETGGLFVM